MSPSKIALSRPEIASAAALRSRQPRTSTASARVYIPMPNFFPDASSDHYNIGIAVFPVDEIISPMSVSPTEPGSPQPLPRPGNVVVTVEESVNDGRNGRGVAEEIDVSPGMDL